VLLIAGTTSQASALLLEGVEAVVQTTVELDRPLIEATPGVDGPEGLDRLRMLVKDFPPELKAEIWAAMGLTGQDDDQAESNGDGEH